MKDKERVALEEKGRINKKIDQYVSSNHELEKDIAEYKLQIEDLSKEKKQLHEAFSNS